MNQMSGLINRCTVSSNDELTTSTLVGQKIQSMVEFEPAMDLDDFWQETGCAETLALNVNAFVHNYVVKYKHVSGLL